MVSTKSRRSARLMQLNREKGTEMSDKSNFMKALGLPDDERSEWAVKELIRLMSMSAEDQNSYFHNMEPDGTSTLLVEDLRGKEQSAERDAIIERAKAFGYDDFRFTMMYGHEDTVCPKVLLVEHLTKAGYEDLAMKVMEGRYD